MTSKKVEELLVFAQAAAAEKLVAAGDCLSVREGDGMIATDPSKPVGAQTEQDIRKFDFSHLPVSPMLALHRDLYLSRPDLGAIVTNHAPYCGIVAERCKKLPATLDDMAQIIGPSARVAASYQSVVKLLGKRNACLVKDGAVAAAGRTPDEAHTAALVLEKGAKAYVEGTILGGAVKIPLHEALLMRFIYKKKYSKADQTAKKEELDK